MMSNAIAASVAFGVLVLGVMSVRRSSAAGAAGERLALPFVFQEQADVSGEAGTTGQSDWHDFGLTSGNNEPRERANVAAFLAMIRAAEGTVGEGGYGALFGYPAAGRSFDPYSASGHPKQFFNYTDKSGKTVRTSAAGAYQITFTTWSGYYLPFVAWCGVQGRECSGFTPGTQDSFAMFLLSLDGALDYVKAGQIDQALAVARRRWASLPGAGYNQPERTAQFVMNAYTKAGGTIA